MIFEKVAESAVDDIDSCRVFMLDLDIQTFEPGQKGIMTICDFEAMYKCPQVNVHLSVPEHKA